MTDVARAKSYVLRVSRLGIFPQVKVGAPRAFALPERNKCKQHQ